MGCGPSQSSRVANNDLPNADSLKSSPAIAYPPSTAFEIPLVDNVDHIDLLSNPNTDDAPLDATNSTTDAATATATVTNSAMHSGSLIRRHPPKRLRRLEEKTTTERLPTIKDLETKLANAELRRNEILLQRANTLSIGGGHQRERTAVDTDANHKLGMQMGDDVAAVTEAVTEKIAPADDEGVDVADDNVDDLIMAHDVVA